ncbi:MAG: hypothetical protein H6740_12105 [Alphaproteobacteria bacterium]|nr:hypothetical protein [Alphaproteobacteria bacterium]
MLTTLLALAAFATPAAQAAPTFLEVGNLATNSWTGEEGSYTRVDDDDSACGCWAQDDGDQALGNFGGTWYLLDQDHCDVSSFPSAAPVGATGTCDPTDLSAVAPLYDLEIEVWSDQSVQIYVDTVPAWGWISVRGGSYGSNGSWLNETVAAGELTTFGLDLPEDVHVFGLDPVNGSTTYRELEVLIRDTSDGGVLMHLDEAGYGSVYEAFEVN